MKSIILEYLVFFLFLFISYQSVAQTKNLTNKPPTLKNGKKLDDYLQLWYRPPVDSFMVISVKFKLSARGILDTLYISENAPDFFVKKAREQLINLDGQWNPQLVNGKPTQSKWLISRFYVIGFRESTNNCTKQRGQEFFDAFKREEELFLCNKRLAPPRKCLIEYVEGNDCYLYSPMLVTTLR